MRRAVTPTWRRQRGFLYLTTGANGSGKTLFTLKDVHALSVKESRPVCYNGRFKVVPGGPLSSWRQIDMKEWQKEPDGTIFVVDECHKDFPNRGRGEPPEYVSMLAEHRSRGFDFFLITQHPMNMDVFVRRLIGSPGWHRHLKRTFGADLVSRLEWATVNSNCEKAGSGESGSVSMVPFPKEVYAWYTSASLHTGKRKIPKIVWFTLAAALAVPALGWLAAKQLMAPRNISAKVLGEGAAASAVSGTAMAPAARSKPLSPHEWMAARTPRLEGFAYTAPAYDAVTQPVVAPYPAACVNGFNRRLGRLDCKCYTQQATLLPVPEATCQQIAEQGFFLDWAQPSQAQPGQSQPVQSQPVQPSQVVPAQSVAQVVQPGAGAPQAGASAPGQPSGGKNAPMPPQYFPPLVADSGPAGAASSDGAALGAMRNGQRRW